MTGLRTPDTQIASVGHGGCHLARGNQKVTASPAKRAETHEVEAVHCTIEGHASVDRFADPLIAEITETWRQRQDMVRAQGKLTLQIKAICRRFCAGDKSDADKLYASIGNGMAHPLAEQCAAAVSPLIVARHPLEAHRKLLEKHLTKLGAQLPIAHMADTIKGVNTLTLAKIVGECGDLSAYEKGVAGIWKRAGLAVIDGKPQRRVAGAAALLHGYSPVRRSVFWNIGSALLKAQGKDENAGPYRLIYDERKAYDRPRVETDGHAHNRAMRFMTKRLLKDLWRAWRAADMEAVQ